MKPPSRASSKTKRAALNVKKAIKKKNSRLTNSSVDETAKAITRARNKLPASPASKPSSSRRRVESAELFWIRISNVHERVAYEDIVRAIFQRCVHLRSKGTKPSNLGGHFQDTIEVAFATKEDAKDAVSRFQNRIKLFQQNWRITHYKPKRSSDAALLSRLGISDVQKAPESSDDGLTKLKQTMQGAAVHDSAKVTIFYLDDRVPIEVVVPLFKTAGRVRSHAIFNNTKGLFQRSVVLMYERSTDAVAAAKLFYDNINFFGTTWVVKNDYADDEDDGEDDGNDHDDDDNDGDDEGDDDDDSGNDDDDDNDDDVEDDA